MMMIYTPQKAKGSLTKLMGESKLLLELMIVGSYRHIIIVLLYMFFISIISYLT